MGLKRKLLRNPQFRVDYLDFMNQILAKGYAEKVPDKEAERDDGHVWYVPHHGVYHPRKPDKIPVVFDCSAVYMGTSLNGQLLQGPDLTNNLLGVLVRFRQDYFAVMGDIESMFFQVRVSQNHVDCLRFLWWPEGNLDKEPEPYRMLVHLFDAASSPSCANFALHQTADDNAEHYSPSVVDAIKKNMYVDDLLFSCDSEEDAVSFVEGVSDLCARGGFRLTKWVSNNLRVLESVPETERGKNFKRLDLDDLSAPLPTSLICVVIPSERALGVYWNIESDSFRFQIQIKDKPLTRRGVLSIVSSVYDPLGVAAPFVLRAKLLLQDLCRREIKWDEDITGDDLKTWQQWLTGLPCLEALPVRRCYKPDGFGRVASCQIHHFADASDMGYGTASYLRLQNESDEIHCSFLMGRARVAPLKKITIPRMELTAATVAVRLHNMILNELEYPVDDTFFWTDSMSVLRYVSNETTRFHTFVANRVTVIRDSSDIRQWRHVGTKWNPADAASGGMTVGKFLRERQWMHGPDFLWKNESEWPQCAESRALPADDAEVKVVASAASVVEPGVTGIDRLISWFSDWSKLKKAIGWMLVAMDHLQKRVAWRTELVERVCRSETDLVIQKQKIENEVSKTRKRLLSDAPTVEILECAETQLLKFVQKKHFSEELHHLTGASPKPLKKLSTLYKLDTFVSDGLIRVGGRLERADLTYDAKHSILLPKNSRISSLIVEHIHQNIGHLGKNAILAVLRLKYWLIGATTSIKRLVFKCVTCRRYQAASVKQKMASLPQDRLKPDDPPFTRTGMDFFGPFQIKRGRSMVKRYGVIFTCLNIRAVHLEVACSLDTDSCINAIRRFVARRGPVKSILSDNGTNLVGAERELREEIQKWNVNKIRTNALQSNICWDFNPPAASHFGGVWERMIRTVRKI